MQLKRQAYYKSVYRHVPCTCGLPEDKYAVSIAMIKRVVASHGSFLVCLYTNTHSHIEARPEHPNMVEGGNR